MMTPEILEQFRDLVNEVNMLQDEIAAMRKSHNKVKGSMTAMPYILHDVPVESYGSIQTLEHLEKSLEEVKSKRDSIEQFITQAPNSRIRLIFRLRYIKGYSWQQVANRIGENATADSVRMECNRAIDRINKKLRHVRSVRKKRGKMVP